MLLGDRHHLAMDRGGARRRCPQREAFHEALEFRNQAMLPAICAWGAGESG